MPAETPAGWTLRLVDLLGVRLDHVTEQGLENLVSGSVREDADLDFKRDRYGNTDQQRRELAGDLAAMGNGRGGLIVVGIREENEIAVELTPVELIDGEEARTRQIAAGNIAPHLTFDVHVMASAGDRARGYYLLIVPPSPLRPHAVRRERDLRYPLRDGTTTRWLGEPEVADMYRDRFTVAAGQAGRLDRVLREGLGAMDLSEEAFIAVALVPTGSGAMPINLARVAAVGEWAKTDIGPPNWFEGFFEAHAPPRRPGVAAHRVTLTTPFESDKPPSWVYVELYDDGAGFACHRLPDPRRGRLGGEGSSVARVLNEDLLEQLARCLLLLGRHAGENCGAWGDALIEARIVSEQPSRLAYLINLGPAYHADEIDGGRELPSPVISRHTAVIDGLARPGPQLLVTTRLLATDLFHAYGSPEVRQIAPDGRLRIRHIHGVDAQLKAWAERNGVELTNETVQ